MILGIKKTMGRIGFCLLIFYIQFASLLWGQVDENNVDLDYKLVAYWSFDEILEDSIVVDGSGYYNNGILKNGASCVEARTKGNYSLYLNGYNHFCHVRNSRSLNITKNITIALWMKTLKLGTSQGMISKNPQGDEKQYGLLIKSNGDLRIDYESGGNNFSLIHKTLTPERWYHLTVTIDDFQMNFYLDGILMQSKRIPKEVIKSDEDVHIGKYAGSYNGSYFHGYLDEIRIYNRVLTEAEIACLAKNYVAATTPDQNPKTLTSWNLIQKIY